MGLNQIDFTKQNLIKEYGINDNVTYLIDAYKKNAKYIAAHPSTVKLEQIGEKFFIDINGSHPTALPKYSRLGKLIKRIWAWFSLRTFGNSKLATAAEKVQALSHQFFSAHTPMQTPSLSPILPNSENESNVLLARLTNRLTELEREKATNDSLIQANETKIKRYTDIELCQKQANKLKKILDLLITYHTARDNKQYKVFLKEKVMPIASELITHLQEIYHAEISVYQTFSSDREGKELLPKNPIDLQPEYFYKKKVTELAYILACVSPVIKSKIATATDFIARNQEYVANVDIAALDHEQKQLRDANKKLDLEIEKIQNEMMLSPPQELMAPSAGLGSQSPYVPPSSSEEMSSAPIEVEELLKTSATDRMKEIFALIKNKSGVELANILAVMLQKEYEETKQDPVTGYNFSKGILHINLRKQIRLWVDAKDELGERIPPGGVIFIVGNEKNVLQVKLSPCEAEIVKGITTYNRTPPSYSWLGEFIDPTVLSMRYEKGNVITRGSYLYQKREKGLPYKSQLAIWQAGEILAAEKLTKRDLKETIRRKLVF